MKENNDFGFIFWIHLIIIILAYASPLIINWKIILLGVFLIYLQQLIFQGCVLTHKQFGKDPYMTFYYHYLTMIGFKINKKKLKNFMTWIMPLIVLGLSLILQEVFNFRHLLSR